MQLRIKLQRGRPIQRKAGKNRHVASALGALLMPMALMAYALGIWRIASDMGFAGEFGITGLFSHWQLWIAIAVALHITGSTLNRYGQGGDLHMPRLIVFPSRVPKPAPPERKIG